MYVTGNIAQIIAMFLVIIEFISHTIKLISYNCFRQPGVGSGAKIVGEKHRNGWRPIWTVLAVAHVPVHSVSHRNRDLSSQSHAYPPLQLGQGKQQEPV